MRTAIIALLSCLPAFGQATLQLSGPETVRPGSPLTLTVKAVNFTGIAGVQWTAQYPSVLGSLVSAVGPQATSAGKALYSNPESGIHLVIGMNVNLIPSGDLATMMFQVAPDAPKGPITVQLTGLVAASPEATSVPLASDPLTILVLAREDLNGDGKTDAIDLQILIDQIFGRSACGNGDLDGDGKCDLLDALILVTAAI